MVRSDPGLACCGVVPGSVRAASGQLEERGVKILITGGAGFIGSAVIRYLIEQTADTVVNVDLLTYAGNPENLAAICDNPRYCFEHVDICDPAALASVFARHQPDGVMHLAAESHVDRSIHGAGAFIQTNIVGTYTLLQAALDYWQSLDSSRRALFRFHHVSTDEVYGDLGDGSDDGVLGKDDLDNSRVTGFSESSRYNPSSPYAATKASADHLVRAWHRTYGLPVLVSNSTNNYGPCQFPEKLIPLTILNILNGDAVPVYGSGHQVRDWLYVDDHARALYRVLSSGCVGHTYNIGGNCERTNLEVINAICHVLTEIKPPAEAASYHQLIRHVEDRPGHDLRYALDNSRIKSELNWAPAESFESGLRKTVQWYLDNPDWIARVRNGEYRLWMKTNYANRSGMA